MNEDDFVAGVVLKVRERSAWEGEERINRMNDLSSVTGKRGKKKEGREGNTIGDGGVAMTGERRRGEINCG